MSLATLTQDQRRRALSHGRGIDGIVFMLMAAAGIALVVVLLIAGLQTAEKQAKREAAQSRSPQANSASEIGAN